MSGEVVAAVVAVDDDVDLEVDGLEQCSIHFLTFSVDCHARVFSESQ